MYESIRQSRSYVRKLVTKPVLNFTYCDKVVYRYNILTSILITKKISMQNPQANLVPAFFLSHLSERYNDVLKLHPWM